MSAKVARTQSLDDRQLRAKVRTQKEIKSAKQLGHKVLHGQSGRQYQKGTQLDAQNI